MDSSSSDATLWITAGVILLLLLLSAFFSGSETALTAASRGRLRSAADRGSAGAARALKLTQDSERLIGSVLLGNNLVNILATSLATVLFTRLLGESGVALATLVMTLLVLIFAEVLPKTYAITNSATAASSVSLPISVVVKVFAPVVSLVRLIVRGMLRIFGVSADPDTNVLAVRDEIVGALALGHSEGVVEKEDRDRVLGVLDLNERTVGEIMLHRSAIEMIDVGLPTLEIMQLCLKSPHTRLPLYRGEFETIVGVLHTKDLLRAIHKAAIDVGQVSDEELASFDVTSVAMEAYFIPETTTLDEQMRQFLKRHTHFALVVDEYGALQGLITLEDILEEIVGEITDEFDTLDETQIVPTGDGAYLVEGSVTIRDLNRQNDWTLPDEEANTVAGLVIHEAQRIPSVGQVFSILGFRFEIVTKEENRIATLKIQPLKERSGPNPVAWVAGRPTRGAVPAATADGN